MIDICIEEYIDDYFEVKKKFEEYMCKNRSMIRPDDIEREWKNFLVWKSG